MRTAENLNVFAIQNPDSAIEAQGRTRTTSLTIVRSSYGFDVLMECDANIPEKRSVGSPAAIIEQSASAVSFDFECDFCRYLRLEAKPEGS